MAEEEELVAYGSYSTEAIREEEKQTSMEGSSDLMELVEGRNRIRILPPSAGGTNPMQVTHQHYIDIGEGQNQKTLVYSCPRMYSGGAEPCGLCAEGKRLWKSGNPEDRAIAKELNPTRRVFANAVNRKHPEKGVQKVRFGKTVHEALKAIREDEDDPCDFTDLLNGYDIIIMKEGTGMDTKYPEIKIASRPSPLAANSEGEPSNKRMNEWMRNMHDLADQVRLPSDDDITALLEGRDPQAEGGGGGGGGGGRKRLSAGGGKRRERSSSRRSNNSSKSSETVVDGEFDDDDDSFPMDGE